MAARVNEGTLARNISNKIWIFARLFVPLTSSKVGCISEIQRNFDFSLVFRSICTTSDFVEGTLARENSKNIWFSPRLFVPLQPSSRRTSLEWRVKVWAGHFGIGVLQRFVFGLLNLRNSITNQEHRRVDATGRYIN